MIRIFYDGQATQGAGGNGEIPEEFKNLMDSQIHEALKAAHDKWKPSDGTTRYGDSLTDFRCGAEWAYRHLSPSPSLPGEQDPAPKLADMIKWMSEGARRNLKNCETNLLEAHYEGYLEALEELSKEMELTPSAETGEQVEGKKEALDPCVCSYAGEGSQYCTYPKCERIKEDMARMADPKAAPRLTFKEQELTPPSVEADQQVPETKPWPLHCYAPGNYQCKCAICKTSFQGDKRGVVCLECAIIQTKEFIATMYQQIATLRSSGQIVASEYKRDMDIVKGERDSLKVERDEYKKGLEDLNTELDDIWNTPAISSKVADWVIKRICYAQQKTLATLNKFTNNTKDA